MFKQITLSNKLIVAFVVVFIVLGLAVWEALRGLNHTRAEIESFFNTNQVRLTAYQSMFANGLLSGVALRNLVLKPSLKKPYRVVPQAIDKFDAAFARALATAADNPALQQALQDIQANWQQSRRAKLKVLGLMQGGDVETAMTVLRTEEHPPWQKTRIAVQKLVDQEEQQIDTMHAALLDSEAATIRLTLLYTVLAIVLGSGIAYFTVRNIRQAFNNITVSLTDIASGDGDLTQRLPEGGKDEVARLSRVFNQFVSKIHGLVGQVANTGQQLGNSTREMTELSVSTKLNMNQQESKIEQVATAMNEMTATVQEVARNAAEASEAARSADQESASGHSIVNEVVTAINDLANEVSSTAATIHTLEEDTAQIGSVLDVIKGIAEQTNLLALNAAIEAARAGEQGRGFAVVADEVRTLASRTQDSTQEIQNMIERLQSGAKQAVTAMEQGQEKTGKVVSKANTAGDALKAITGAVSRIAEMNTQIATAAEEQSSVAEDINQNIVSISTLAVQAAESAEHTAASSQELERMAQELDSTISVFRV